MAFANIVRQRRMPKSETFSTLFDILYCSQTLTNICRYLSARTSIQNETHQEPSGSEGSGFPSEGAPSRKWPIFTQNSENLHELDLKWVYGRRVRRPRGPWMRQRN